MQLTIGCGFNTIRLLSYPDQNPLDPQRSDYYKICEYRSNRSQFYLRLYKILSNEPFNNCNLFNRISKIAYPEYSPAIREGMIFEPFDDTVKRVILGFENKQNLPLFHTTPIWNDNVYYKMDDEQLKQYFAELLNIYPPSIKNPVLELKQRYEDELESLNKDFIKVLHGVCQKDIQEAHRQYNNWRDVMLGTNIIMYNQYNDSQIKIRDEKIELALSPAKEITKRMDELKLLIQEIIL